MPPPRPPNKELIEHEQKRKIEAQLYLLEKELRAQNQEMSEAEVREAVGKARQHMVDKLKTAPTLVNTKESH